ncbi:hypothetical protein Pryu01_01762 [Paraliobacillus ryukyuensis]|uniref:IDEAL domain-containing protein n=1 Tax=Paraliobacillus ryukyuensis TaxID=200904 RepID=A0A366E954_9BACI|nr:IDEAL domain-containing protein [Paraliobacillus ryukyuensis]RBO98279.1 IDEAL domain-containing protein [Paraliobacillus ryukyuensis]
MKKQKTNFVLSTYSALEGTPIKAKKEISFEIKLASRLLLDELVSTWNKSNLEQRINESIDQKDKPTFMRLSKAYQTYTYEF